MTAQTFTPPPKPRSPASRYNALLRWTAPLSAVFSIADALVIKALPGPGPWLYPLSILPAIPLVAAIVLQALWLRAEPDEFRRVVATEAMLYASGVVLASLTVIGFLGLYRSATTPSLLLALVYPVWLTIYGSTVCLVRLRYR